MHRLSILYNSHQWYYREKVPLKSLSVNVPFNKFSEQVNVLMCFCYMQQLKQNYLTRRLLVWRQTRIGIFYYRESHYSLEQNISLLLRWVASYRSCCQHFLSTTVITQPWWFLPGLKTSMQTVGVFALCLWSLADLTVTAMFRKIW